MDQSGNVQNCFHHISSSQFGIVVIGRNEGQRLITCFDSISHALATVYVDSKSTDDSVIVAKSRNIEVVELDLSVPFTAARARNAGLIRLQMLEPGLRYVQFVDGDCQLSHGWLQLAVSFLDRMPDVAAVCGRLRERYPERSVYNWLCDKEWDRPSGEVRSCAGNVMMRIQAVSLAGGYREDVIAAEEDELCVRLRSLGWRIWRLPDEMGLHDAAMTYFRQWWRRSMRTGYAFAQGSHLHGRIPERHFVREFRRAWIWGFLLPLVCTIITVTFRPFGWTIWLVYPLQLVRQTARNDGSFRDRASLAFFQLLARFPEAIGQFAFLRDMLLKISPKIIEHK